MNYGRYPWLLRGPTVTFALEDDTGTVETPAATETPAAEGEEGGEETPAAEGAAEAGTEGQETPETPAAEAKPTRVPWQTKRIGELTATAKAAQEREEAANRRATEAEERAAAYEALYGRQEGTQTPPATVTPQVDGERRYTQSEVQAEAARIAGINALNQRCEALFNDGDKAFATTWRTRVNEAGAAFGDQLQSRPDLWEAMTALPNGAGVYHELTGDLDHLAEVLAMNPVQMGMELARLSQKVAAKPKGPKVSQVPAPIDTVDGGAKDDLPLEKQDMSDYVKTREAQRAARAKERGWV